MIGDHEHEIKIASDSINKAKDLERQVQTQKDMILFLEKSK
jgi:hypothetical protein